MKLFSASLAFICAAASSFAAPSLDYLREVKPIFTDNCCRCHGASQQKAGLRLDTAALALKGGDTGPAFKPGNSVQSLLVQALKGTHPDISRMPYKKPPLPDGQIALIERWINEGAKAPADEVPEVKKHWAFIPPTRPTLPQIKKTNWLRNAIDNFILARLEKEGLTPSPEADRITLIRRVTLDLTGLPPTISDVDNFVRDQRPNAYERVVESLLGSPHYGERWGRHWLDLARYSDSNGYSIDAPRSIWKYRDWVINALNQNLPFDQFVIDQLAGDLLPNATLEQKIATGFHRTTQINQEGGIDPEQFRVESVIDRVNTTGTAFLGLTIGCAQCHDHKFDPISQREYYQLLSFFNSTVEDGHGKATPGGVLQIPGEMEAGENIEKELEETEADLDRYLDTKGSEVSKWEQSLSPAEIAKLKPDVRKALNIAFAERTKKQKRLVYAAFHPDDPEFKSRNTKLTRLQKKEPKPVTTLIMAELKEPRQTFMFIKGDFTRPGEPVTTGVPAVLHPLVISNFQSQISNSKSEISDSKSQIANPPPSRLDLAHWIVDPANPLTARVTVNRLWQQYFGRGLVETENDFGAQGSPPSHPELLDWLSTEFQANGWSLKHIHHFIVTSATYRQSSRIRPDLATIDSANRLLARQSRLRLDAELVRDVCLSASGLLVDKVGGPSVFPPQPDGVMNLGQSRREWKPSSGPDRYRRGLYTFFWRATPHPALMVFDGPDAFSTCTRRLHSNTPLQALTLLNDAAFYEFAEGLAHRITSQPLHNDSDRIDYAFRLCVARQPNDSEKQRLKELLAQQLAHSADETKTKQAEAWTTVARVLLNLDETITRE